jgi:Flp pilus assembly protein TadB
MMQAGPDEIDRRAMVSQHSHLAVERALDDFERRISKKLDFLEKDISGLLRRVTLFFAITWTVTIIVFLMMFSYMVMILPLEL